MTEFAEVNALAECYRRCRLNLTVSGLKPSLAEYSLREICIQSEADGSPEPITVTVFDEYGDAEINNPVIWLHLVLASCESVEEAEDYNEWLKDEGYADTEFFNSLYVETGVAAEKIRQIVGAQVKAINHFEIELNTGIAQALRSYRL